MVETVLLIFPVLQTNITSQVWSSGGKGCMIPQPLPIHSESLASRYASSEPVPRAGNRDGCRCFPGFYLVLDPTEVDWVAWEGRLGVLVRTMIVIHWVNVSESSGAGSHGLSTYR